MDKDILFLGIIALAAALFGAGNAVLCFVSRHRTEKTQGTILSVKTVSPATARMRNSKWAIVTYQAGGKTYTSKDRVQVPLWAEVGNRVPIRYNRSRPEQIYRFSPKRIAVSALVVAVCLLWIAGKLAA